jgi:hypothetical protein
MPASSRFIWICLLGVIVSLLLVGLISGTPLRHLVQITPVAIALLAVWRRDSWSAWAALAIFLFWFGIMALIWLFLLGIANVITGHFTTAEIVLTLAIGAFCILGVAACARALSGSSVVHRVAAFLTFAAFQIGFMWLSFQPFVSHR